MSISCFYWIPALKKKTSKIKWILLFTTNSFHFNHKFEYIRFYISIKQRLIWEELNFMHNVLVFGVSDSYRTDFLTTMFVFSVLLSLRFESISLYCWSRIMKLFINTVKHYRMSNVLKAYTICFTFHAPTIHRSTKKYVSNKIEFHEPYRRESHPIRNYVTSHVLWHSLIITTLPKRLAFVAVVAIAVTF